MTDHASHDNAHELDKEQEPRSRSWKCDQATFHCTLMRKEIAATELVSTTPVLRSLTLHHISRLIWCAMLPSLLFVVVCFDLLISAVTCHYLLSLQILAINCSIICYHELSLAVTCYHL